MTLHVKKLYFSENNIQHSRTAISFFLCAQILRSASHDDVYQYKGILTFLSTLRSNYSTYCRHIKNSILKYYSWLICAVQSSSLSSVSDRYSNQFTSLDKYLTYDVQTNITNAEMKISPIFFWIIKLT